MEDNLNPNPENDDQQQDSQSENGWKTWLQDNLRIIISIVIVVAIAAGIYSYSNRTEPGAEVAEEDQVTDEDMIAIDDLSEEATEEDSSEETGEANMEEDAAANQEENGNAPAEKDNASNEQQENVVASQETDTSFIESAQPGDGLTHLARRALKDYLEKNPDSQLLPEHKIYVEDYLRKKVGFQGGVNVGTSVEFSKDLIKEAIGQAKTLNENQIQNLSKYVVNVPSLT